MILKIADTLKEDVELRTIPRCPDLNSRTLSGHPEQASPAVNMKRRKLTKNRVHASSDIDSFVEEARCVTRTLVRRLGI